RVCRWASLTASYVTVTPAPTATTSPVCGSRPSDQVPASDQLPLRTAAIVGGAPKSGTVSPDIIIMPPMEPAASSSRRSSRFSREGRGETGAHPRVEVARSSQANSRKPRIRVLSHRVTGVRRDGRGWGEYGGGRSGGGSLIL